MTRILYSNFNLVRNHLWRTRTLLASAKMSIQPSNFHELLAKNEAWRNEMVARDPTFFERCAHGQQPSTLCIGCADSRVPESVITGSLPGSIFTHRNIANQVRLDDVNVLSVLEFAVEQLRVEHIVVIGHSECRGVEACITHINSRDPTPGHSSIYRWLRPLAVLADFLGLAGKDVDKAVHELVEENVKMQVANLANTETIKKAWRQNPLGPVIHGWVYDLKTGLLRDLHVSRRPIEGASKESQK